ncbi:hypothetical protein BLOT_004895 [Blomia tropicalis]|nr:hypothetical protein BLOT_004895 [Blomia tropicalis]
MDNNKQKKVTTIYIQVYNVNNQFKRQFDHRTDLFYTSEVLKAVTLSPKKFDHKNMFGFLWNLELYCIKEFFKSKLHKELGNNEIFLMI